jgi:hypothetical protein
MANEVKKNLIRAPRSGVLMFFLFQVTNLAAIGHLIPEWLKIYSF